MLKLTVKNRLMFAFLAILILPCSAISWFSYQNAQSEITNQILQNATQSVQFANNQITDLISKSLSDMDYLATHVNQSMIDGQSNSEIKQVLDPYKAVNPQYEVVIYGTKDKFMFFTPERKIDGYDPTTRSWYIKAMENKGKAVVSDPFLSATNGHMAVNPVKATADGSGVVGASLDLSELAKQVNTFKIGQNGYVFILDKDHKYVTNPTIAPGTENTESFVAKFYEKDSGTVDFVFKG